MEKLFNQLKASFGNVNSTGIYMEFQSKEDQEEAAREFEGKGRVTVYPYDEDLGYALHVAV